MDFFLNECRGTINYASKNYRFLEIKNLFDFTAWNFLKRHLLDNGAYFNIILII